jgi:hypothetical protein
MQGHKIVGRVVVLWLGLLLWSGMAWGQTFLQPPLTEEQYAILANDIKVVHQSEFQVQVDANQFNLIRDAYNAEAVPLFYIYRGKVSRLEILFTTSSEGTTFTWTTNGFVTRTSQEIEAWRELFSRGDDSTSPGQANVQAALLTIFAGAAGTDAQKNRVHIGNIARRPASRAERLYVTSGTGTKADAGVLAWEGKLSERDIAHALTDAPLN